jgi:hypothetical protein
MKDEIEKALVRLQIEGKETRKTKARNILVIVAVAVLLYLVQYAYPQFSALLGIVALIALFGGIYIVFDAIPSIYQPLKLESHAFKEIAQSIEILEKSNETIAYKEACRHLKKAIRIVREIELSDLAWYKQVNVILEEFLSLLERFIEEMEKSIVDIIGEMEIPIAEKERLEDIALAIYSRDPMKIDAINQTFRGEPWFEDVVVDELMELYKETRREKALAILRGSGNIAYSLALGYSLILGICIVYVVATGQDFMVFLRENPETVILGGGVFSGLTFWRIKPRTERKSAITEEA